MQLIPITEKDFAILSNWASVSRTLRGVLGLIPDNVDDVWGFQEELETILQSLDNVNAICKTINFAQKNDAESIILEGKEYPIEKFTINLCQSVTVEVDFDQK